MQHDTTTCNMIQQHTTRWSNGTNFFFTTNVARCCMKSWYRLTGALLFQSNFKPSVYRSSFADFTATQKGHGCMETTLRLQIPFFYHFHKVCREYWKGLSDLFAE